MIYRLAPVLADLDPAVQTWRQRDRSHRFLHSQPQGSTAAAYDAPGCPVWRQMPGLVAVAGLSWAEQQLVGQREGPSSAVVPNHRHDLHHMATLVSASTTILASRQAILAMRCSRLGGTKQRWLCWSDGTTDLAESTTVKHGQDLSVPGIQPGRHHQLVARARLNRAVISRATAVVGHGLPVARPVVSVGVVPEVHVVGGSRRVNRSAPEH